MAHKPITPSKNVPTSDEADLKTNAKEALQAESDLLKQQIPDRIYSIPTPYNLAVNLIIDFEDKGPALDNKLKSHQKKHPK